MDHDATDDHSPRHTGSLLEHSILRTDPIWDTIEVWVINLLFPLLSVSTALVVLSWFHVRLHRRYGALSDELGRCATEASSLRAAVDKMAQIDGRRDEFVSTVSHELRTPLTSIRASLGLLASGALGSLDHRAEKLLRIASNNAARLVRLLDEVLDFERMESGFSPPSLSCCEVFDLLEEAVDTMSSMGHSAGVTFQIEGREHEQKRSVKLDHDRILQVLCNLLSNAIKYSPSGSCVLLKAEVETSHLVLRVKDSGRGVPAEKLESIFEPFAQVEASDYRLKGGAGLGLAICRSIVNQHRGHIFAESNRSGISDEAGTTFVVRLPLAGESQEHYPRSA